jgi:outer membrane protein assembly factor BamB
MNLRSKVLELPAAPDFTSPGFFFTYTLVAFAVVLSIAQQATAQQVAAQTTEATVSTASDALDREGSMWSQWRGPQRTGEVGGAVWPETLDDLERVWRVELGKGYPGPVVGRDRVFVLGSDDDGTVIVQALARADGTELWRRTWSAPGKVPFFAASHGTWVRSTPAFDGRLLFVGDMREMMVALDAETGAEVWRIDLPRHFGVSTPPFGFASSPVLDGEVLYVQAANGIVKLDKNTGVPIWRAAASTDNIMSGGAFSSPVIAEFAGRRQLIAFTRAALVGIDLASGETLWQQEVPSFRGMNIVTPLTHGDGIFVSQYQNGSYFYEAEPGASGSLRNTWTGKASGYMSTPVKIGDYAYLHLGNGRFSCVDLRTGEEKWRTTPFSEYWSMVWQGDRILALDADGVLRLIRANPERYEVIGETSVADAQTWGHVALADDQIFVRELEAISVFRWPARATSPALPMGAIGSEDGPAY